jgi:hypothetical protein
VAKVMSLMGASSKPRGLGADDCKCVYNPRTKRYARLCFVGKSHKNRSGFAFRKGGAEFCKR